MTIGVALAVQCRNTEDSQCVECFAGGVRMPDDWMIYGREKGKGRYRPFDG